MEKKIIPLTTTQKKTPTKRKASTSEIVKTKADTVDGEKLESVVLDGNLKPTTGKTKATSKAILSSHDHNRIHGIEKS